jgi:hypothetical protein
MKYQLVLQWPAALINDYDAIVEIENAMELHTPTNAPAVPWNKRWRSFSITNPSQRKESSSTSN